MIGQTISHYKVLEKLGQGGMGVVYKAEDIKLKRTVALKFISPQALERKEEKTRFVREAQAAAVLDHPNICTIYEIDEAEEKTFIAMAYIEGQTLQDKIESAPLKQEDTLEIAMQIADGLQEAHEKGVVHRDIKSSNIMVTKRGQAKIMDFGLSKLIEGTKLTTTATIMGTVAYMSPEQACAEPVDHRTDIWSLGIVLYEMLTGQLPFKGEYAQVVLHSILNSGPQPITSLRSGIPLELEAVVTRCLEKDPTERYQTAADLKADLKRVKRDVSTGKATIPTETTVTPRPFPKLLRKIAFPLGLVILALVLLFLIPSSRQVLKKWLGIKPILSEKSLAVLPFTIIGDNSDDQAFCDGLIETLSSKLSKLEQFQRALWVVPIHEVLEKEIITPSKARGVLGVNLVVNGSAQRIGDMVSLTVNLIDTRAQQSLGSLDKTDHIANLLTWQDSIVIELTELLDIELRPQIIRELNAGGTALPSAYESYLKGRGYMQHFKNVEDLDRVISLFKQAIKQDSQYALAYAGLGEAYWNKHELTKNPDWIFEAKFYFNRAIQINEHLVPVYINLGIVYRKTGRYNEAIKQFKQALQLDPLNYFAHLELATVYDKLEKLKEVEEIYNKAIELRPSNWLAYNRLGHFYWRYGPLSKAERMFRQVTKLTPENVLGYNNLGVIYCEMSQNDLAIAMFDKSLAIEPNPDALSNLGTIYFFQRRYAKAAAVFREAVKSKFGKDDYTYWGNLADTYRYMPGYREDAQEAYKKAIQLAGKELENNPREAYLHGKLAFYYAITGDHKNALAELLIAQKLAPADVKILRKAIQVYELANQRDQALHALKELIKSGASVEEIHSDPDLAKLRADPCYKQLVRKEGSAVSDSSGINK